MHTVFAPNYGSPFVRDLDRGRRYGTIEDFRNFVKLTYLSPNLHHSGGTVCEPVDVPVNKRHLDMVYAHMRYSDKPFMGSVTAPERARDTVEMARILFGAEYLEDHAVILSLINANSPLVWDATMLGAARAYAEANQATLITPFILAGAMSPVTVAGTATQTLAEALGGMTFVQLVRPGAPVVLGSFASSMSMQSGAPTFGTPEPSLVLYVMAALARRLGVPFRSGGNLCASKIPDAQAAYESAATFSATILGGVNFVLHAAGWLEGGLAVGYEKFILDADQCGMAAVFVNGVDLSENGQALDAILTNEPGQHFLGTAHTLANFENAFYRSEIADNNSFEQWQEDGVARRGAARERDLEADARRVRGAADRRRHRRGPARVHRQAQGVDARLRGLGVLFRRHRRLATARAPGARPRPRRADVRARPAQERASSTPTTCRRGATVSVTASPAKGIEATVALCEALQARGFRAVPHLSARMVRDRAHLRDLIAWLEGAGVDRAFVVGGDAKEPGDYPDGLSLLREMAEIGHPLAEIGIPCYPQGHAFIAGRAARRGPARQGAVRELHDDAALLRPGGDRRVARRPPRRGPDAAGPHRRARRRGAAQAAGDHGPDRRRRHASIPDEERAVRRATDPLRRLLPPGRPARGPRPDRRGPGGRGGGPAPVHVQQRRGDRGLAAALSSRRWRSPSRRDAVATRASGIPVAWRDRGARVPGHGYHDPRCVHTPLPSPG